MKRYVLTLCVALCAVMAHASSPDRRQCRDLILSGSFDEAVRGYAALVESARAARDEIAGVDEELLAEYAYSLALAGYFDGAVVNIDRARLLGKTHTDFYTAQILSLMSYPELAAEFWTESQEAPSWIAGAYKSLVDKYKSTPVINGSDLETSFRKANMLASRRQFVQSVVIYQELADNYPGNAAVHVGYSTVLEKMNRLPAAARELQKGISGLSPEQTAASEAFNAHLVSLNAQIKASDSKSWFDRLMDEYEPSTMLYAGGAAGTDVFSLSGRLGFYTNNNISGSLNIGYAYAGSNHSFNIGVAAYQTIGRIIYGLGINESISSSDSIFSITPAVGLSFMNKEKNASYDILLNLMMPLKQGYPTNTLISFGRTFYFSYKGKK